MRKLTKTERVILDLLRQGHRPKSHSADIVP
jgi:DNA-binding CsgD family transcriptional regulator